MLRGNDYPRFLSRPVKIRWLGWETTTYHLQQAGWELSAEQDVYENSMRIAIRHPQASIMGITERTDWRYQEEMRWGDERMEERYLQMRPGSCSQRILIERHGGFDFRPIDAQPQFTNTPPQSLEELAHFAPQMVRSKAIVLDDASVDQLLSRALELQEPARQAYYEDQVREKGLILPRHDFRAQIITLRDAA